MEKIRTEVQLWNAGRENVNEIFYLETEKYDCIGVEMKGYILYYSPISKTKTFCLICLPDVKELVERVCEFSTHRFKVLVEHLPTLARVIVDGAHKRYDRCAFLSDDKNWFLARQIDFALGQKIEKEGVDFLEDEVLLSATGELAETFAQMSEEIDKWEGFTTWEEIKIGALEFFDGVKIGLKVIRIDNVIGKFL